MTGRNEKLGNEKITRRGGGGVGKRQKRETSWKRGEEEWRDCHEKGLHLP